MSNAATIVYTHGAFVWHELYTRDVTGVKAFYGGLFGWAFDDKSNGDWSYVLCSNGSRQIAGIMDIANMPDDAQHMPAYWSSYISVADVDATEKQALEKGGTSLVPAHDLAGVGRFAHLQDPQGAIFALLKLETGDGAEQQLGAGDFCWESLSTSDLEGSKAFYSEVIGWNTSTHGSNPMTLFGRKDAPFPHASLQYHAPSEQVPTFWMSHVAVENLDATVAKAEKLGGTVLAPRIPVPEFGAMALLKDPGGAVISIFEGNQSP